MKRWIIIAEHRKQKRKRLLKMLIVLYATFAAIFVLTCTALCITLVSSADAIGTPKPIKRKRRLKWV